ncbi:MAG: site-specific DNA-methyltransferase [Acidobacteria bacterium]|nr:site-specific DNA-methyltransferase [Acidobacteriota bacterium]
MERLKMHTPDFTDDNVARIAAFFPNCVTETADENGNLKRAIDFDLLKQELSGNIVEGPKERYHLDWPGKRESLLTANAPIAKTFRPCREESVDFDTTKNLYVEGDNLDALKLLQETYLGKVKMIYIDPPYNTGNDFIYEDDFAEDKDAYFQKSMQTDEEGNRLVANTESNGRFHSDWLSMMYPRLKLARNLLRDDGVIFISIDDNEQANLKRLCDEVFGEENFVAQITRATGTPTGGGGAKAVVNESDFLLVYSKSQGLKFTGTRLTEEESAIYDKEDEQGIYLIRPLRRTGGEDRREDRPTMYYSLTAPDNTEIFPIAPAGYESRWICGKDKFDDLSKRGLIEWKKSQSGEWNVYQKFYLEETKATRQSLDKS